MYFLIELNVLVNIVLKTKILLKSHEVYEKDG